MTSPAPSAGPSRRRVAGLALVGVGVIAAIIGLGSLVLGGGDDGGGGGEGTPAAAPPASTAAPSGEAPGTTASPAPTAGAAAPTDPATITVPTFATPPAAAAPPAGQPGSGTEQDGAGAGGPAAAGSGSGSGGGSGVSRGPIRVYNNSTISGLAADAAADLRGAGWEVGEVANYPFGIIRTTTVYYEPGTAEQATAEELGREFGMRVSERFEGLEQATPGVIVIVTNDYQGT